MLITMRSPTTTQRLHSLEFSMVDKAVHSTALLSVPDPRKIGKEGLVNGAGSGIVHCKMLEVINC